MHHRDMKTGYVILYHFLHTDATEMSQCDHAIKYVLHHDGTQCTYCKYFKLLLWYFNSHGTQHITKATCVLCSSDIEYETISCFCSIERVCSLVSVGYLWSVSTSRSFCNNDEKNKVGKTNDSSNFANWFWQK